MMIQSRVMKDDEVVKGVTVSELSRDEVRQAMKMVGTWVQIDRKASEALTQLILKKPRAAALMTTLISNMGQNNAVIISRKNLARILKCHPNTIDNAVAELVKLNWIQVVSTGGKGSANAYRITNRVVWSGARDGIRYARFQAEVVVSDDDQLPMQNDQPLWQIPSGKPGEPQIVAGEGLPPPSEPSLPGMEPPMPTTLHHDYDPETGEIIDLEEMIQMTAGKLRSIEE